MLRHASVLRSSHLLWNASAQNEGGVPIIVDLCQQSVTLAMSHD